LAARNALERGQRQRIAIARAILKDSPIANPGRGHLGAGCGVRDVRGRGARQPEVGRTTFVIAHRLSTIRARQDSRLEDGQSGKANAHGTDHPWGTYARLHDLQFADDDMLAAAHAAPAKLNVCLLIPYEANTTLQNEENRMFLVTRYAKARRAGWLGGARQR